jgi:hypothetical protein
MARYSITIAYLAPDGTAAVTAQHSLSEEHALFYIANAQENRIIVGVDAATGDKLYIPWERVLLIRGMRQE